jgi:hypothetical protein
MKQQSLRIQYRGDEYKVEYDKKMDCLIFAIKILFNKDSTLEFNENQNLLKFASLREYLKAEGFFEEYFSKQEETF